MVELNPESIVRLHGYSTHNVVGGAITVVHHPLAPVLSLAAAVSYHSLMTVVSATDWGARRVMLVRGMQRMQICATDQKWGTAADGSTVLYGVEVPDLDTGMMMLHMGFSI